MKITEILKNKKTTFSFEFFPPKTPESEVSLYKAIERLKPLHPTFISVTCGAMGTTREKTAELTADIKEKLGTESIAHVTCVACNRDEIFELLGDLKNRGIKNILALRGDPPEGVSNFQKPKNGFGFANELVRFIRDKFGNAFSIGVAGYPEGHPECADPEEDLQNLKRKVDEGADFVITQLFFVNDNFLKFQDRAKKIGIKVPIIPGIMPVTNIKQLLIFEEKCGVIIPAPLRAAVAQLGDNREALEEVGIEYATRQSKELLKSGVPGLHFYTLNRSKATKQIFENLNLTVSLNE